MNSLLKGMETVAIDSISPYPDNPRLGDVGAIAESLRELRQFRPLVVQESTRYILGGNHTYAAAHLLGWEEIDVVFIDVPDRWAQRIVLADNRTSDLGGYNEAALAAMLNELREEDEALLLGTAYDNDDVDSLIVELLAGELEGEEADPESIALAASILDGISPAEVDEEEDGETTKKPSRRPSYSPPTEFVVFRFGELRAKVSRETYDDFVRSWLRKYDDDLQQAGVAAALRLGLPPDKVEPALAEGAERWL